MRWFVLGSIGESTDEAMEESTAESTDEICPSAFSLVWEMEYGVFP